jgi:NAD(P)-dependent dehydrogenase (short-subunit alcohol dehydrogenase family)
MKQLQDKVCIVTGAGRGIGRATAIAYGREGAKVVVASRTQTTVDEVAKIIRDEGGTALGVTVDVGKKDQVFAMVDKTVQEFGTVDVIVNNAQGFGTEEKPQASTVYVAIEDTNDDELYYTFKTGCMGTLWGMQAVFPYMKEKGGRIINFASGAGMTGNPGNTSYNATKEAIRAISRTAANEWGKYQIIVSVVNPALRTDAFEAWEKARPEYVKTVRESIPLKRLGDPLEDGGPTMVFLASDGNRFMTGMTYHLVGGRYMP